MFFSFFCKDEVDDEFCERGVICLFCFVFLGDEVVFWGWWVLYDMYCLFGVGDKGIKDRIVILYRGVIVKLVFDVRGLVKVLLCY